MDLIIKPTQACNFACSFCSSSNICEDKNTLDKELIFDILKNNNVETIIVNGGDPLMMKPQYYIDILDFIKSHNLKTFLSFTTNLWDFYKHPDKWTDIFKNKNVGVCTSFQYGNQRILRNCTVFDEKMFLKVMDSFRDKIGYTPMFISVLTNENERYAVKTVNLAKRLNTICKLNPQNQSGRSKVYYPFHKAMEIYLNIMNLGLGEYEQNCIEIKKLFSNQHTICPFNRDCLYTIRALSPNNILHSCGSFNDDYLINKSSGKEDYELHHTDCKKLKSDYFYITPKCLGCELFELCNSCYKRTYDIKENHNEISHCDGMKKLKDKILKLSND